MLQLSVIGHIGGDAVVKEVNGKKFVSFNVAHSDVWTDEQGAQHESTFWVSCAISGDGGKLLPYLRKGQCVFVQGRGSTRVYSSPKERRMVAGLNISVDKIELVGAAPDRVPRELFTSDSLVLRVNKFYGIDPENLKAAGLSANGEYDVIDRAGNPYRVVSGGWVLPVNTDQAPATRVTDN